MLPELIVVVATYHYIWRLYKPKTVNKCTQTFLKTMVEKYTQTEVPWLFYTELVSEDYMDTSDECTFSLENDMDVDSPPASDWGSD